MRAYTRNMYNEFQRSKKKRGGGLTLSSPISRVHTVQSAKIVDRGDARIWARAEGEDYFIYFIIAL